MTTLSITATIVWLLLPLIAWLYRRRIPLVQKHRFLLFLATVTAGFLLYIATVWLIGKEIEHALYKFDLDGDRMFSEAEMTPAAKEAMRRFANDTGRSFAPLVAAPATLIWTSVCFLFLSAGDYLSKKLLRHEPKCA